MKIAKLILCLTVGAVTLSGCSSTAKPAESSGGTMTEAASESDTAENSESSSADTDTSEEDKKDESSSAETSVSESSDNSETSEKSESNDDDKTESGSDESKLPDTDKSDNPYIILFDGEKISLPCIMKDLKWFTADKSSELSAGDYCTVDILYDGEYIGNAFFDSSEDDKDIAERTVIGLDISPMSENVPAVEYNGLCIGDSEDKMTTVLGEPDEWLASNEIYQTVKYYPDKNEKNKYLLVGISDDKINTFSLYIK